MFIWFFLVVVLVWFLFICLVFPPENSTWELKLHCAFPSPTAAPSTAHCSARGDGWPKDEQPRSQDWAPWNKQMLGKEAVVLG